MNQPDEATDFQIEFIDTQSIVKTESLTETEANCKLERSVPKVDHKKGRRKKFSEKKISCEMCGKLVASNFIEFHLNVHKGWVFHHFDQLMFFNDCILDVPGIRPYKCEAKDCEKYFISPGHAKNHYTKVHVYGVSRPHKCDVCGRYSEIHLRLRDVK